MFDSASDELGIPQVAIFDDDPYAAIGLSACVQKMLGFSSMCFSGGLTEKSFKSFSMINTNPQRLVFIVSVRGGNDTQLAFLKMVMNCYKGSRFIILVSPVSCKRELASDTADNIQLLLSLGAFAIIRKERCAALKEALQAAVHANPKSSHCCFLLRSVCGKWIDRSISVAGKVDADRGVADTDDVNFHRLTVAEDRVLSLFSLGFKTEQIAKIMNIGVPTVRGFLHRAKKKMRARTRCHLIALWMCFAQTKLSIEQMRRSIEMEYVPGIVSADEQQTGEDAGKLEA